MSDEMVVGRVDGRTLRHARREVEAVPAHPTYVAYYRVSTQRQGASGFGLEAQRETVLRYVAGVGGGASVIAEFTEIESGKQTKRPELKRAIETARMRRATLVIAKLDRLARNVRFLLSIKDSGADVVFCDFPNIPPGPTGRFIITQMAAVAELEAGLISQRTREALAMVKRSGKRLGNPRPALARQRTAAANRALADRFALEAAPVLERLRNGGLSLRGIARFINAENERREFGKFLPAHGQLWHAATVRDVLLRAKALRSAQVEDAVEVIEAS